MKRVFNFSAGPSILPLEVLEQAQKDLVCYKDTGMSVMEMSHRTPMFENILANAKDDLRTLMNVPDDYEILFLQGGATMQFAMVPLNIAENASACYVESGSFASKAIAEAKKFCDVNVIASSKEQGYSGIPDIPAVPGDAKYLHITTNNTIYGTQYNSLPDTGGVPLVADMSSNILGKYYDTSKFAIIYAGAQKNIAPAGVTIVIIRKDLLGKAVPATPVMLDYKTMAAKNSMYNTPPCWNIYIASLVFKRLLDMGGVKEMEKINIKKSSIIYEVLDSSDFYMPVAEKKSRSIMNVTFRLANDELTAKFVSGAAEKGLVNIKGHRSVGGIRASMYNAMPLEGAQTLADYMLKFEKDNK